MVKDSLVFEETVDSKRYHNHPAWEPEWIKYNFTAWAECTHPACKQKVCLAGIGTVDSFHVEEGELEYKETFEPHFCNPMPNMIEIPDKCPAGMNRELLASFKLFLMNADACANRIRSAVEHFMDSRGIKKRDKNKQGKYFDLSLHRRIEIFTEENSEIGKQLMALKWLGNAGSHEVALSRQDPLDGYEIIEYALAETVGQRSQRIKSLANQLQKKYRRKKP